MKMRELAPMSNQDNADITAAKMVAIRQAAEQGNVDAQYLLGLLKEDGDGCDIDPIEAVRWYREAADQDHAGAQYRLAQLNEHGVGCEINLTEAFKWYRRAALQDYPDAREDLFGLCRAHPDLPLPTSELLDGKGRS
jgi:TPR repeat protein